MSIFVTIIIIGVINTIQINLNYIESVQNVRVLCFQNLYLIQSYEFFHLFELGLSKVFFCKVYRTVEDLGVRLTIGGQIRNWNDSQTFRGGRAPGV